MKILTVRQPWAWAIIHGGKDVENRSRNIAGNYRGPVALHAGLTYDFDAALNLPVMSNAMARARTALGWGTTVPWSTRGAIIGVVDLVDVHPGWLEGHPCTPWGLRYVKGAGQHHLMLANPRPLSEPIPYRGALGLRELPADVVARIEAGL